MASVTPKRLARSMTEVMLRKEIVEFAHEQIRINKDRPDSVMFWRELIVELLALKERT